MVSPERRVARESDVTFGPVDSIASREVSIRRIAVAPRRNRTQGTRGRHRPEERVARLLEAAATTFAACGYANARVQDMCRGAGVSVGTFYQHFEDKADLLAHLVDLATDDIQAPDLSSRAQFERDLATFVRSPKARLWRAWREALLAEPKLNEHGARIRAIHQQRIERIIRSARSAKTVQKWTVDDRTAAWLTLAAMRELIFIDDGAPLSHPISVSRALWHVILGPSV
jgi:AcrR family transcriptional regulator